MLAFFGSCFHNTIGKGLLDISEISFNCMCLVRVHTVQKPPCGGLKVDVNSVRKLLGFVVCSLEAKLDIVLNSPDR